MDDSAGVLKNGFNIKSFLQSLKAIQPPWSCPKCSKYFKSYVGIEQHLVKFHHSAPATPSSKVPFSRKSKLKFSIKKKNNRLLRRSPSPIQLSPTHDDTTSLTWAEAQQMVELESDGKMYRLNISDKLDILSDSDGEGENDLLKDHRQQTLTTLDSSACNSPKLENHMAPCIDKKCNPKTSNKSSSPTKTQASKSPHKSQNEKLSQLPKPSFNILSDYENQADDAPPRSTAYYRYIEKPPDDLEDEVEYDMDEEDAVWLELMNKHRADEELEPVSDNQLELLMDRFEKESYFEQAKHGHSSQTSQSMIDEDAVCCVCNDGECQNSNVILFCDMCNLAIHQECYGVPYIPEGQWLCRRCLQSPSSPVDCCLCPNKTGAFKQTDDNRWAHVVCALWIPEVGFGNTVFLEPIDDIKNIPPARWKLTCYVCKQRNAGACIQCHKTNCYTAFHVTCAQQAGLYMNMEVVKRHSENGVTIKVKKEAYCDAHVPKDASPRHKGKNIESKAKEDEKTNDKMKKARKILAEKRLEAPQISIPYIPRDRLLSISRLVSMQKRSAFMQRLLSYWTLKRQSRNGVPLLRRLQSHVHSHKSRDPKMESEQQHLMDQLSYWQRLRHDLERARLLIELLRKREKLKREAIRISQIITDLRLTPLNLLLHRVLSKLMTFDTAKVFFHPVKESEAPDYFSVIERPMDFSTMSTKIDNHLYRNVSDFENDFNLIVSNCIHYNGRESVFYRFATRMRDHGGTAIRAAKREVAKAGFDEIGMLLPKTPEKKIEETIDDEQRLTLPLQQQLDIMLVRLDQATLRAKKTKKIRAEIAMLKRKIARENNLRKSVGEKTSKEMTSGSDDDVSKHATTSSDSQESCKQNDVKNSFSDDENSNSRERLWSKRRSLSPSEVPIKKRRLSRCGSCPIPFPKLLENRQMNVNDSLISGILATTNSPVTEGTRSLPPSPTERSVNRRTAVLFNKKPRSRLSTPTPSEMDKITNLTFNQEDLNPTTKINESDNYVKSPMPHAISFSNLTELDKKEKTKITADDEELVAEQSKKSPAESSETDVDSSRDDENDKSNQDDSTTTEEPVTNSSDDDDRFSDTESKVDEKIRTQKAVVSLVRIRDAYHSDESSSDASTGHKPGVILGNNAVVRGEIHKPSSTSDEEQEGDMDHIIPLDLVWAKCWGYPPYPALLIDPNMPRSGYCHNGVPIPVPPMDVLRAGEDKRNENGNKKIYLVLFFDTKRTWQWLPRNKLELLGVDSKSDQSKLAEGKRPAVRKNVEAAFKRALLHRSKVTGEIPDSDDDVVMEEPPKSADS